VAITVLLLRYLLPTAQTSLADLSETALRDAQQAALRLVERQIHTPPGAGSMLEMLPWKVKVGLCHCIHSPTRSSIPRMVRGTSNITSRGGVERSEPPDDLGVSP